MPFRHFRRSAELIFYRADRLELHSSRRTAELNFSSYLPSSFLFLQFSYSYSPSFLPRLIFPPFSLSYLLITLLLLILDMKSLSSYFPLPFFDCYLRKFFLLPIQHIPFLQAQVILENSLQHTPVLGLVSRKILDFS